MKKAVFLDVDGTLLPEGNGKSVLESTKEAIKLLQAQDIGAVLCTGRHPTELVTLGLLDVPYDGFVLLNGQLVPDRNMKKLYSHPITGIDKKEIVTMFEKRDIPVVIVEEKRLYLNFINENVIQAQADVNSGVHAVGEYNGADILMSTVYADENVSFSNLRTGRWHKWAVDVYHPTGGKANGIREFIKRYGVEREDVIVFGDAQNDIEMIKYAGVGIAMGNAYPETKKAADFITDDCEHDGIWNGLKKINLI